MDDVNFDHIEEEREEELQGLQESRVGKKLSEMTTRRVIILVLTMLLVLPFLQTDDSSNPPQTPWFAADNVYELWGEWNQSRTAGDRLRYERSMLKYFYYHNWFSGNVNDHVACTDPD